VQKVEHRKTVVRSPQTNSCCERFHRTLREEFFSVALRKRFYELVRNSRPTWVPSWCSTISAGATKGIAPKGEDALAGVSGRCGGDESSRRTAACGVRL